MIAAEEKSRLQMAFAKATDALLAERDGRGVWTGKLSTSALSTATAVVALATMDRQLGENRNADYIQRGLVWLSENQNADGGWGDTVLSKSNLSTTALCWAAFGAAGADEHFRGVLEAAVQRLIDFVEASDGGGARNGTALASKRLTRAIADRYGKDRTFSIPILMTLAIAGRLGANAWRQLPQLPFELAALPHQIFGALRLPVVSYALPALIAIGQAIHFHAPTRNPLARWLRGRAKARTLRVLAATQPPNGGFLEATPLTSFVTMALASMKLGQHPVAQRGLAFLRASAQPDGSWPIDTNLATWTTTLAAKALTHDAGGHLPRPDRAKIREWLLTQQYRVEHPYTHAAPGGWAWTDLPGGVPDADDTAGALLALHCLGEIDDRTRNAASIGIAWLLGLQNRDGGIPTFCRGWGALPFDRSAPDLTAHALRAWNVWLPHLDEKLIRRVRKAARAALRFLEKNQRADGSWLPLWFGNEHAPQDENPVYGTAQVLIALSEIDPEFAPNASGSTAKAACWLSSAQNADGGWGGVRGAPSSVEETALAVEALAGTNHRAVANAGVRWLIDRVESGTWREPSPIGFYFAKLWYYERLYPMIFTVGALGRVNI